MSASPIGTDRREVTIGVDGDLWVVPEWDMPIGNPLDLPLSPVMVFMADDVHACFRFGKMTWPQHGSLEVSRDGFATATVNGQPPAVYELFPARFHDGKPYEPKVFVGRWPD